MNSLRLFSLGRARSSFGYIVATAITLVVVAPAADPAATLLAQTCKPQIRDPECAPLRNPTAAVSPHVDTTTSPTARVTYNVSDAVIISTSSFTFKNNGTSVYAPISWVGRSGSGWTDVALASGTNTIVAYVCNSQSLCAADTARIVFNPPTTQSAPTFTVSGVAPLHHNGFRPASPCPGCVTTLGYATPSYTSLDASRSLAIGYSSTTAAPMGYVMLRVMQTTPDTVKSYSLKLFTTDGYNTQVTFTNGSNELFYQASPLGRYATTDIAAQFDASAMSTGANKYVAVLTAAYAAGGGYNYYSSSDTLRILIVNEKDSPLGRGVSWLGVPRLVSAPDGMILLPGDGSASFFKNSDCGLVFCNHVSPDGTFSSLTHTYTPTYTLSGTDGSSINFSANGLPQTAQDRFGNQTTFTWDSYSRLTTVTDPAGKTITVGYNGTGVASLRTITDGPLNRTSTFAYDGSGHVTSVAMPSGDTAFKNAQYDASHRLTSVANTIGAVETRTYSNLGWVRSITVAGPGGALSATTLVRPSLDTMLPAPSTGTSISNRWTPGPTATVMTTPTAAKSTTTVDRFGNVTSVELRDPLGRIQQHGWIRDQHGRATVDIGPRLSPVYYGYSGSRLVSISGGGDAQQMKYTTYDQVDSVLVNGTLVSQLYYSGSTVTLDSVYQGGARSYYHWDSRGRPISQQNAFGGASSVAYQSSGLLNTSSVTAQTGGYSSATTTFTYDAGGRVVKSVGPTGLVDSAAYDVLNRAILARDADGRSTRHGYNLAARRDSVIDARNNIYKNVTDHLGRDTLAIDPLGKAERFIYDALGQLQQAVNRRGQSIVWSYDSLGRVTRRIAGTDTARFAYDTAPNGWVAATNGASTDTIFFDSQGRPRDATTVRSGTTLKLSWTYDLLATGRNQLIWAKTGGAGDTINYSYDTQARLKTVGTPSAGATSLGWGPTGYPDTVTFPTSATPANRLRATIWHSPTGRLSSLGFPGNTLSRWYAFDTLDRTATAYAGANLNAVGRTLRYDRIGRLTSYTDSSHVETDTYPCLAYDEWGVTCISWGYEAVWTHTALRGDSFTYDEVGNRTDRSAGIGTGNRLTAFDGYTLTYDDDGNLLTKTKGSFSQTYTWNVLGQLTAVTTNGSTTTFAYDAWGRRIQKVGGGGTTNFLLDGQVLVAELNASFAPVRTYSYWPGTDRPHSMKASGNTYFYTYEEPGHVVALVNGTGSVANTYSYDPWGNALATSEAVSQPLRYTGRELDSETGLYYYRARYYDPALARFTSEDPIGLGGGVNQYAYVGDDPVNFTDPSGQEPCGPLAGPFARTVTYPDGRQECVWPLSPVVIRGWRDGDMDWRHGTSDNFGHRGSGLDHTDEALDFARALLKARVEDGWNYDMSGKPKTMDCNAFVCYALTQMGCAVGPNSTRSLPESVHYRKLGAGEQPQKTDVILYNVPGGIGHMGFFSGWAVDGSPMTLDMGSRFRVGRPAAGRTLTHRWILPISGFYRPIC